MHSSSTFQLYFAIILYTIFWCSLSCRCSEIKKDTPDTVLQLFPKEIQQTEEQQPATPIEQNENIEDPILIRPPYLHSPTYLTNLAQVEQGVYEVLKNYEKELLERLQILQRYRTDYEDSVTKALIQVGKLNDPDKWAKAEVISSNPMLAFRMIRRFTLEIPKFIDHIWKSLENELWETLENAKGDVEWPTGNDALAAIKSLIRLQNTYDFNLENFVNGAIRNYPVTVGLTAQQSLDISKTALALGDVTAATEWFQVAHSKAVHGQYGDSFHNSIPMDELTESWEHTYNAFRELWPMTVFKTHDVFAEAKSLLRNDFNKLKMDRSFEHRFINFKALCRGDQLKSAEEIAELICFYDFNYHPYLRINPLKVEIHNWDPIIYQVHDFVGGKTMHEISVDAVSAISSVIESGLALTQSLDNDISTLTYSWLFEESTPSLQRLSRKLSILMGLHDMNHRLNNYQISSYAVGNHYDPCVDCFSFQFGNDSVEDTKIKTRTTVHAVLHAPEQGGELAFTLTGTVVKPLRGSLIVYNNLKPHTEEIDENILHGSCPVLIGQKWVATKLISSASPPYQTN